MIINYLSMKETYEKLAGIILSFLLMTPFIMLSRSPTPPPGSADLRELIYLE